MAKGRKNKSTNIRSMEAAAEAAAAISIRKWNINVLCMDLTIYAHTVYVRLYGMYTIVVYKMFSMRRPCRTYDKAMASLVSHFAVLSVLRTHRVCAQRNGKYATYE